MRDMTFFKKFMDDQSTVKLVLKKADGDISFPLEKCSMHFAQDY